MHLQFLTPKISSSIFTVDYIPSVPQMVENLPVMKETWVQVSGSGKSPAEENVNHSRILAGESYGLRSLAGYMDLQ